MTHQSYSEIQFIRPASIIDILANQFVSHGLLHEMTLTRLRNVQLLLVDDLLDGEIHTDRALHHLGRRLARAFLKLVEVSEHGFVPRTGMESLVDGIVPTLAHAQRNGEHSLNRGGFA